MLAGALLNIATTSGSVTITATDSSGALQVAATTIQLAGSGTSADDGLVRKSDLEAAINALAAIVQGGSGVAPPSVTASTKTFSS